MIEKLIEWDKKLLLLLNSFRASWLDPVVLLLTETFFWLPLYLFLLYVVIKTFKKKSWIPLLGITLTIVLTDRITSGFMKPFFQRLRPSRDPSLQGMVQLVTDFSGEVYYGGLYGFASSHAANTFGTAFFFWLLFRKTKSWIVWLFPWAVVMTYTRIYLGAHYPGDIIVGGLVGLLCGWIGYQSQRLLTKWMDANEGSKISVQ
jgi:undecaprenyl-diphosphatase